MGKLPKVQGKGRSQVLSSEPDFSAPELWPLCERARERVDFEPRGLPRMTGDPRREPESRAHLRRLRYAPSALNE